MHAQSVRKRLEFAALSCSAAHSVLLCPGRVRRQRVPEGKEPVAPGNKAATIQHRVTHFPTCLFYFSFTCLFFFFFALGPTRAWNKVGRGVGARAGKMTLPSSFPSSAWLPCHSFLFHLFLMLDAAPAPLGLTTTTTTTTVPTDSASPSLTFHPSAKRTPPHTYPLCLPLHHRQQPLLSSPYSYTCVPLRHTLSPPLHPTCRLLIYELLLPFEVAAVTGGGNGAASPTT